MIRRDAQPVPVKVRWTLRSLRKTELRAQHVVARQQHQADILPLLGHQRLDCRVDVGEFSARADRIAAGVAAGTGVQRVESGLDVRHARPSVIEDLPRADVAQQVQGILGIGDGLALVERAVRGLGVRDVLGGELPETVEGLLHRIVGAIEETGRAAAAVVAHIACLEGGQGRKGGARRHVARGAHRAQGHIAVRNARRRSRLDDLGSGLVEGAADRHLPVVSGQEGPALDVEVELEVEEPHDESSTLELDRRPRSRPPRLLDLIGGETPGLVALELEDAVAVPAAQEMALVRLGGQGREHGVQLAAARLPGGGVMESEGLLVRELVQLVDPGPGPEGAGGLQGLVLLGSILAGPLEDHAARRVRSRVRRPGHVVDLQAEQVVPAGRVGAAQRIARARRRYAHRERPVAARRVLARVLGFLSGGGPLDLGHRLGTRRRVGSVQGRIAQPFVFQRGDRTLPDVRIDDVRLVGLRQGGRRKVDLLVVAEERRRSVGGSDLRGHAAGVDHTWPDLQPLRALAQRDGMLARHAAAHDVGQPRVEAGFQDIDQLVPIAVGDHPALLLIDAGVALVGAVSISGDLCLHLVFDPDLGCLLRLRHGGGLVVGTPVGPESPQGTVGANSDAG